MVDQGNSQAKPNQDTPRRASSSSSVSRDNSRPRREDDQLRLESKRSNVGSNGSSSKRYCAAQPPSDGNQPSGSQPAGSQQCPPSLPSTSQAGSAEILPALEHKLDLLTNLLSGLVDKLDNRVTPSVSPSAENVFSGCHDLSLSDSEDGEEYEVVSHGPDPLDGLEALVHTHAGVQPATSDDDSEFLKALSELSGIFLSEEASIVNASLRRRPVADSVKITANKIKVPSNVPNMKFPETNPPIVRAMSVGGKLVDARLTHINGLLTKALVPITQKEVARIHVNDTALAELCKWECEVGTEELFPFDVVKKCDEIHKTKKLGRPSFHPFKTTRNRGFVSNRQDYRKPSFKAFFRPEAALREEDAALQNPSVTQPSYHWPDIEEDSRRQGDVPNNSAALAYPGLVPYCPPVTDCIPGPSPTRLLSTPTRPVACSSSGSKECRNEKGRGYSSMNIIRSAISAIANIDAKPAGQHPLICRFMKAVFLSLDTTWYPDVVLTHLRSLGPNEGISVIQLSKKLVMLMLLVSVQSGHTLRLLDIRNMTVSRSEVSFRIGDLLKTSRPGVHPSELVFTAYAPERLLCVYTTICDYLDRTAGLRGPTTRFFLTTK
ncbi:hypothetical protein Pmani_010207 [Petrolisthes manimaculis]|uniref:Uncharacterized protein n=1 Tax=Petrolisthes manimaculis TaxID=1843537 RepID=A0AAE1UHI0_9EUCA|nr:hypothetical protein Pmani_010207 [Petrolisthes manimaculis]